ncbi:Alpha beta hydrolase fold-3 [Lasiodiplodia theobromae]|uniref:Alpha beta hydrolase fold-3 n=1 Tax=Lasiodiplodia theobromae TaxID=45133 RepID=UPI0015C409C9|nr:Alpha beta hydrolase fold-3 [Lasiodiplodia theobromae]KAF4543948.1 Alpha beta hydrolase fold-3 [Lasiodiplodia theobromae]
MPGSYPPSRPDSPSSVSAHTRDHDDAHLGSLTNAAKEPQEAESSEPKFATPKLRGGGDDEMHARVPANLWYLAGGSGAPPTYKNYRGKRKSARKKGQDRAKEGYWKDVIHWGLPREKKRRPEGGDGNGEVQPAPMDRPPSQNPDPKPAQPPQQPQEEPPLEQPPHQEPLPQEPPPQEPPPQEQPPQEQPPQDDPPHDPPADPFADPPADPDPPRDPPDDDVAPRRGIPRDQIMELYGEMLTDFFNNVDRVARQILDDLDARRMIDGDDREERRRRRTW